MMKSPDPSLLNDIVASKVIGAMKAASAALSKAGVRHLVAGGLAVAANGYPRATKDVVDFLVGGEAFEHHAGGLVMLRPGIPFQVSGIAIDFLSPGPGEEFLEAALEGEPGSILDVRALVYLKLRASRMKDQVDVIELVKASLDVEACRRYLSLHAPDLVDRFDALVMRAEEE